ncbi:hypothetical protein [Bacillus sp. CGMCC 1.16541]|uniref:hypothetical protein n=1 Tax=Bacillus sp. CGMCC 1.16541 TaxID=2185143 RepID=UPI000D73F5FB|nr:hypothetical protein [Bacillus sp. CGMCC 1.16541]
MQKGDVLSFEEHIQNVLNSFIQNESVDNAATVKQLDTFPGGLYSQKDLMEINNIKYKVELYRMLNSLGVNKLKIGNLVRYDKKEIEEAYIAKISVSVTDDLVARHGTDYIDVIKEEAIQMLDKSNP